MIQREGEGERERKRERRGGGSSRGGRGMGGDGPAFNGGGREMLPSIKSSCYTALHKQLAVHPIFFIDTKVMIKGCHGLFCMASLEVRDLIFPQLGLL